MRMLPALLLLAGLSACAISREAALPDPLLGNWELIEMEADRGLTALPAGYPVRLTLSQGPAGNIRGEAFVNSYWGTLQVKSGGAVTEAPSIGATRTAGPAPVIELEAEYFDRWEEAARVVVERGQLRVYDAQGKLVLRFERPV